MNKKLQLFTMGFVSLFLVMGVSFAEGISNPVTLFLFRLANRLAMFIFAVSIVSILISAFMYMSTTNHVQAERAKTRIVFTGIGLMIVFGALAILRILGAGLVLSSEPSKSSPLVTYLVGMFIVLFVGGVLYTMLSKKIVESEEETEEKSQDTIAIHSAAFFRFAEEAYRETNGFASGENVYASADGQLSVRIVHDDVVRRLTFLYGTTQLLDSQYATSDNEPVLTIFSSHFTWDIGTDEVEDTLNGYHVKWTHEAQIHDFNVEEWVSAYTKDIHSEKLKTKVSRLLASIHHVLSHHHQLSHDDLHLIETAVPNDIEQLVRAYHLLPSHKKESHVSSVGERLDTLQKQVDSIAEKLEADLEKDLEYAYRIIDKKYKKE